MKVNLKFRITDLPALSPMSANDFWGVWEHSTYKVAKYVSSHTDHPDFPIIGKMAILRTLIENGNKPFYASDLLGASEGLGGIVNGLSRNNLIEETGNVREVMVLIDEDIYRKCKVKEWQLALPLEDLQNAYAEVRQFILENL